MATDVERGTCAVGTRVRVVRRTWRPSLPRVSPKLCGRRRRAPPPLTAVVVAHLLPTAPRSKSEPSPCFAVPRMVPRVALCLASRTTRTPPSRHLAPPPPPPSAHPPSPPNPPARYKSQLPAGAASPLPTSPTAGGAGGASALGSAPVAGAAGAAPASAPDASASGCRWNPMSSASSCRKGWRVGGSAGR